MPNYKNHEFTLKDVLFETHNRKDQIKVALFQPEWPTEQFKISEGCCLYWHDDFERVENWLNNSLQFAKENEANLLVFPELSIPEQCLTKIRKWTGLKDCVVIAGSTYYRPDSKYISRSSVFVNGQESKTDKIVPAKIETTSTAEEELSNGNSIKIFRNTMVGTFAVLICSDYLLSDIHRHVPLEDLDFLIVPSFQSTAAAFYHGLQRDVTANETGIYIIYANNVMEGYANGGSAIFGQLDKDWHQRNLDAGLTDFDPDCKIVQLGQTEGHILAECNLKVKRPNRPSSTGDRANIKVLSPVKGPFLTTGGETITDEKSVSNINILVPTHGVFENAAESYEMPHTPLGIQELIRSYSQPVTHHSGKFDISAFVAKNHSYIKQILSLPKYMDVDERVMENSEFCVALGRVFLYRRAANASIVCEIYIPENPFIALNGSQRRTMELRYLNGESLPHPASSDIEKFIIGESNEAGPFLARVTAGGAITVLEMPDSDGIVKRFIAVGQKDAASSVDPHKLIPQSGIAEFHKGTDDWVKLRRLVVGECVEEIRIVEKNGENWYLPDFRNEPDGESLNSRVEFTVATRTKALARYRSEHFGENPKKIEPYQNRPVEPRRMHKSVTATICPLGEDTIEIFHHGSQPTIETGHLAIDAEIGVVDLMQAIFVSLPHNIDELSICDGEIFQKDLLWRNLFLFLDDELLNLINGKPSRARFFGDYHDFPNEGDRQWGDNIGASLSAEPAMAVPLKNAARNLLTMYFGVDDAKISVFKGQGRPVGIKLDRGRPKTKEDILNG